MTGNPIRRVVCDTGPLISLEKLSGGFRFIRRLYDGLIVPPAVLSELAAGLFEGADAYQRHYGIEDLLVVREPLRALSRKCFRAFASPACLTILKALPLNWMRESVCFGTISKLDGPRRKRHREPPASQGFDSMYA